MKVLVLYGTLTMNTEIVAQRLFEVLETSRIFTQVEIINMMDLFNMSEISGYDYYVIGTSTWSDGSPPPDAEEFMEKLQANNSFLQNIKVSFFGLGEMQYEETFCDAIKNLRKYLLEECNAEEVGKLHTIDGYPDDELLFEAEEWMRLTIKELK